MDEKKKSSSLPSSYVSLLQLQERWLQDKQRKQEEAEREQRRSEDEENQRLKKDGDDDETRFESHSRSVGRRPVVRNYRKVSGKDRIPVERGLPEAEEKGVEAVNFIGRPSIDGSEELKKKKKWRRRRRKGRKPNSEEDKRNSDGEDEVIGGKAHLRPNSGPTEQTQVNQHEIGGGTKALQRGFLRTTEDPMGGSKCVGEEASASRTVMQIERKFGNLSIGRNVEGGKFGSAMKMNVGRPTNGVYGSFGRREGWRPKNSGLVWIRKGGSSPDGDVAIGERSSSHHH